ncbi:hypothetical protein GCM10010912_58000 [Paenibacillus albidus]|uniref:Uncharacterized protein n=1 Tax=Paenibacillus albidus TaxID=2041023 RepID=A0A917D194_9BACL|nr:hypothetical protein [Paenibacillus albidus]GGG05754.1 hypothetical protein GCM10010912_58000 [Paenibacillus albidus]
MKKQMKKAAKNSGEMSFWKEERGDIGVKQIAGTVAVIVIIGLVITAVQGNLSEWIDQIWTLFIEQIEKFTK